MSGFQQPWCGIPSLPPIMRNTWFFCYFDTIFSTVMLTLCLIQILWAIYPLLSLGGQSKCLRCSLLKDTSLRNFSLLCSYGTVELFFLLLLSFCHIGYVGLYTSKVLRSFVIPHQVNK